MVGLSWAVPWWKEEGKKANDQPGSNFGEWMVHELCHPSHVGDTPETCRKLAPNPFTFTSMRPGTQTDKQDDDDGPRIRVSFSPERNWIPGPFLGFIYGCFADVCLSLWVENRGERERPCFLTCDVKVLRTICVVLPGGNHFFVVKGYKLKHKDV